MNAFKTGSKVAGHYAPISLDITDDPKMFGLASALKVAPSTALGIVVGLIIYLCRHFQEGQFEEKDLPAIENCVHGLSTDDPRTVRNALVETGWIIDEEDYYRFAGWDRWAGKRFESLKKDRDRKRRERGKSKGKSKKKSTESVHGQSTDSPRTVPGLSTHKGEVEVEVEGEKEVEGEVERSLLPPAPSPSTVPSPEVMQAVEIHESHLKRWGRKPPSGKNNRNPTWESWRQNAVEQWTKGKQLGRWGTSEEVELVFAFADGDPKKFWQDKMDSPWNLFRPDPKKRRTTDKPWKWESIRKQAEEWDRKKHGKGKPQKFELPEDYDTDKVKSLEEERKRRMGGGGQ
ncbi:MAG: hypothetical protein KC964_28950 [Candidatus Omnitrophica bacterium]|nr:hypothetical protein [Candidatus Omnitrophota bacterium]